MKHNHDVIDIAGELRHETDKAYQFFDRTYRPGCEESRRTSEQIASDSSSCRRIAGFGRVIEYLVAASLADAR